MSYSFNDLLKFICYIRQNAGCGSGQNTFHVIRIFGENLKYHKQIISGQPTETQTVHPPPLPYERRYHLQTCSPVVGIQLRTFNYNPIAATRLSLTLISPKTYRKQRFLLRTNSLLSALFWDVMHCRVVVLYQRITTRPCVTCQKRADIINIAAEAWNHGCLLSVLRNSACLFLSEEYACNGAGIWTCSSHQIEV
jgi:hypothetical protein